jgi:transcriptional regulator with XRE-family HTH domain
VSDLPALAQFLRSRRERLAPEQVGLRPGGRRRTPGLRREEVATLAGVSIDYLVRLEQGRDTNPSADVLAALAGALQLDPEESRHLLGLASFGASPHLGQFCPAPPVLGAEVAPTVEVLLAQLQPIPAVVLGALGDVVASNEAWRTLVAPMGLLEMPNVVRHFFLHPHAATTYPDWEALVDVHVARLAAAHRQLESHPAFVALLDELLQVPRFAERWAAHPVSQAHPARLRLRHPDVGELRMSHETLEVTGRDQQLVTLIPADEASERGLGVVLAGEHPVSPAHLRVVGDA